MSKAPTCDDAITNKVATLSETTNLQSRIIKLMAGEIEANAAEIEANAGGLAIEINAVDLKLNDLTNKVNRVLQLVEMFSADAPEILVAIGGVLKDRYPPTPPPELTADP